MDGLTRKPLEGVANIVRFNWPFYAAAGVALLFGCWLAAALLPAPVDWVAGALLALAGFTVLVSLAVSWWVYDASGWYDLAWLCDLPLPKAPRAIANIHAGFDETSGTVALHFPGAALSILDFYNPTTHPEPSIRRARKLLLPYPGTQSVETTALPLPDASQDVALNLLSAHEVRDPAERAAFLREQARALAPGGCIVVAEHLRDLPNALAYSAGVFHFHSRAQWLETFARAGLSIIAEQKHTPFITIFFLRP